MKKPRLLEVLLSTLAAALLLATACGGGEGGMAATGGASGGGAGSHGTGGLAGGGGIGAVGAAFTKLHQMAANAKGEVPAVFSLAGTSPNDAWIAGQYGTMAHWQDGVATVVPTPATGSLTSLSVVSTSRAFVVDYVDGVVYRWDGQAWAAISEPSDARLAIWADAADSLWSVGGVQDHWDGKSWQIAGTQKERWFGAITGTSASNVLAGGELGGILRYDGTAWSGILESGVTEELGGAYAASPDETWFVGQSGAVVRWQGAAATVMRPAAPNDGLTSISGTSSKDVWIGTTTGNLLHWDGSAWASVKTPAAKINCVWAAAPGEVWFGDTTGGVYRYR